MRSFILMLFIAASAQAGTINKARTKVNFTATGTPGFLTIDGTGGKFSGTYQILGEGIIGLFICELKYLTTDLALRDKHMKKKYLQVHKYPTAKLKVIKVLTKTAANGLEFVGDLTLKGQTRMVTGTGTIAHDGKIISKLDLTFKIDLKDYGFEIPNYLGVTVARTVDVRVRYK